MDKRSVPGAPASGLKRATLMPGGLRERLMVAFALMSVLPLLVLGYVVSGYAVPAVDSWVDLSVLIGVALLLALLGFMVATKLVFPVIRLASDAQAIASGDTERHVEVKEEGELGELGTALNRMTDWARENMAQLKAYGEQAKHLNMEINERVLALSYVLQASNLITQSVKLPEVRSFILEKLSQMEEAELNCVLEPLPGQEETFLIRAAAGKDQVRVELLLNRKVVAPWLAHSLRERRPLVIDDRAGSSPVDKEFLENLLGMQNIFCQPLTCMGKPVALLVSANRRPAFVFEEETLNLLRVFAKQMMIAIENDFLSKRAAMLEVKDELTGLYNGAYIRSRLNEEVSRAVRYNRSVAFILLKIDEFPELQGAQGGAAADEKLLRQVGDLLAARATEVDRVGRTGQDEFAMILPEQNKREAIELAEEIRAQIAEMRAAAGPRASSHTLTVSAGVSENPIDGATGRDLLAKAVSALEQAKRQGKNRVIAA